MSTTSAVSSSNSILQSYLDKQSAASSSATSTSSSSSASSSLTGVSGNLNTFLKILTTQLQHQDPTAATDTNQFTQELVQFAGAEQQINTNSKLDTITNLLKSTNSVAGNIGYIGKYVKVPTTNTLPLQNGSTELAYDLDSAASNVSITVQDVKGKTVATLSGATSAGTNYVSWDGKDSSGSQLADGAYTFTISATNSYGATVKASNTYVVGKVTSVASNSDGTTNLGLGSGMTVLNTKVDSVYESGSLPTATAL